MVNFIYHCLKENLEIWKFENVRIEMWNPIAIG